MEAGAKVRDQYLNVNRNRRLTYAFLSRMYEKEITIDLLEELTSEGSLILRIKGLQELEGELREGFKMLSGYLRGLGGRELEEVKLELAVEYANLFLGVGGKMLHPSESAYRSKDHFMIQEPRDEKNEVKKYLEMQKEFINDHIALWVPQLAKDILENAKVDFYKGVANITNAFIELERKAIDDLIQGTEDL